MLMLQWKKGERGMSSFGIRARHKVTGIIRNVGCIDDYFGKHNYGYLIDGCYLTEDQFYEQYSLEEQADAGV